MQRAYSAHKKQFCLGSLGESVVGRNRNIIYIRRIKSSMAHLISIYVKNLIANNFFSELLTNFIKTLSCGFNTGKHLFIAAMA